MDKMLQWTLQLGQNVTVDVVNLDEMSRQRFILAIRTAYYMSNYHSRNTKWALGTEIFEALLDFRPDIKRITYSINLWLDFDLLVLI
jgi:hypothetical protein